MTRRIEFTVADEVGDKYDEARGHEPLASWIKRALESALSGTPGGGGKPGAVDPPAAVEPSSASSRASKTKPSLADTWRR